MSYRDAHTALFGGESGSGGDSLIDKPRVDHRPRQARCCTPTNVCDTLCAVFGGALLPYSAVCWGLGPVSEGAGICLETDGLYWILLLALAISMLLRPVRPGARHRDPRLDLDRTCGAAVE